MAPVRARCLRAYFAGEFFYAKKVETAVDNLKSSDTLLLRRGIVPVLLGASGK